MKKIKTHILKIEKWNQVLKQVSQENLEIEIENTESISNNNLKPSTFS